MPDPKCISVTEMRDYTDYCKIRDLMYFTTEILHLTQCFNRDITSDTGFFRDG